MYQKLRDPKWRLSDASCDSTTELEAPEQEPEIARCSDQEPPPALSRQCMLSSCAASSDEEASKGVDGRRAELSEDAFGGSRIRERYVIDNRGWWMVFDVPPDHYLHGCYAEVNPYSVPKGRDVEVYRGIIPGTEIDRRTQKPKGNDADAEDLGMKQMFQESNETRTEAIPPEKEKQSSERIAGNLKIQELEKELTRVKAKLAAAAAKPDTTAAPKMPPPKRPAPTKSHRKPDRSRAGTSASELSPTDYDTCRELEEVKLRRRGGGPTRKPRKGHRKSGTESDGACGRMAEETIAAVVQKFLKKALPTIQENVGPKDEVATGPVRATNEAHSTKDQDEAGVPPMMGSFNPHMMPLMKFKGDDWEDFIEHFESFADTCGMTEAYRLQYLLMSLEGKPRAYAKKEEGVPYTYTSVRRRLQHR